MGGDGPDPGAGFYQSLPPVASFASLADDAAYAPLPAGWSVGVADIVNSTQAIAAGRYKEVNTAAAAVIAAVSNALPERHLPFVFGGDGAGFAVDPGGAGRAQDALSQTARWIGASFGLEMRVAMVPVESIRAAGLDVRVARLPVSADLAHAMFTGGGLAFAEDEMKKGRFAIPQAEGEPRPDLTGLSCRFSKIPARNGLILSLIVIPPPGAAPAVFARLVSRLLARIESLGDAGRPVPEGGPPLASPIEGLVAEARVSGARKGRSLLGSAAAVGIRKSLAHLTFALGLKVGAFDPRRYLEQLVRNSDFRKFGDGLRMTVDCTAAMADEIEALLDEAQAAGVALSGRHRQDAALMTCFVPSPIRGDHVHFLDGASGGYAMAALALKSARDGMPGRPAL